jgi:hypothetical protein
LAFLSSIADTGQQFYQALHNSQEGKQTSKKKTQAHVSETSNYENLDP